MNQQTFAKMTGISTASLSSIFNSRTQPTLMHVEAIKKKFPNINLEWLLYGVGGMFVPTDTPTPTSLFDDADPNQKPAYQTVHESSPKTDIMTEGMINFDEPAAHSAAPQVANARKVQQPTFAIQSTPTRRITEIRVFYDDQTWESFVPKKQCNTQKKNDTLYSIFRNVIFDKLLQDHFYHQWMTTLRKPKFEFCEKQQT